MKELKNMAEGTQTEQNIGITTSEAWRHASQHGTVVEKGDLLDRMKSEGKLGTNHTDNNIKQKTELIEFKKIKEEIEEEIKPVTPSATSVTTESTVVSETATTTLQPNGISEKTAPIPPTKDNTKTDTPKAQTTTKTIDNKIKEKTKKNVLLEKIKGLNHLFNTHIIGKENIGTIPQGKNIIIATTHIDNWSVGLAINALGKDFPDITVAEESTHYKFLQDPANYFGNKKNSFRVDYDSGKLDRRGKFDPKNLEPMRKSLEEGKPLAIAAQYDPSYKNTGNELSEKAGNGAAYLAQITKNAIILPVAIDVKLDKPLRGQFDIFKLIGRRLTGRRVNADVIIGKPFVPTQIENINHLGEILQKRKIGTEPTTKEELQEFSQLNKQLKEQSGVIMQRLAELLPPQKRGVWGKK